MKQVFFFSLIGILFLVSCGTPKQIIRHDKLAMQSADSGNYEAAISEWETYINTQKINGDSILPLAYAEMGKAYFALEDYPQAEANFDIARDNSYADPEMYVMMQKRYKSLDNLSKEITVLEYYRDHFSQAADSSKMRNRLFETSLESENWVQAEEIWTQMDEDSKNSEEFLGIYFVMNKDLENTDKCDEIARQLLKVNKENKMGLDWLAKKYYNLGENRYQNAMKTYNKKKTSKTYKILLNELDKSTADYKKALTYLNVLWQFEGKEKYAVYLANIYGRFDDKKQSQYYKRFITH
ncbi:MAG: hypothetical protein KAH25_02985 [Bacteroidales bacterium]|nr:hypothetical protein [Bacteroidales bacterium]